MDNVDGISMTPVQRVEYLEQCLDVAIQERNKYRSQAIMRRNRIEQFENQQYSKEELLLLLDKVQTPEDYASINLSTGALEILQHPTETD